MKTHEEGKDLNSVPWQLAGGQLNEHKDSLEVLTRTSSSEEACSGASSALGWPPRCGYTDCGFEFIPLMYDTTGGTRRNSVPNKEKLYSVQRNSE